MTNHVHLLCTPQQAGAVSLMMQSVGRRTCSILIININEVVPSGREGRYKSCLAQEVQYLIEVYRYIEMNPVRAKMVNDPSEYVWSSYQINALGKESDLCTSHLEYLRIGTTNNERMRNYRDLFTHHIDGKLLNEIRLSINKGMAVGHDRFKGRPEGWRKQKINI